MSVSPPAYDLPNPTTQVLPPTYTSPSEPRADYFRNSSSDSAPTSNDVLPLPVYTARPTTEPHTLSRSCFHWGFLCPFLWIIGIAILWIDLKVDETVDEDENARTEEDGEGETAEERMKRRETERQVMDEKISIVRKAEIRWSRYCAIALSIELIVVLIIVGVIVAASMIKG